MPDKHEDRLCGPKRAQALAPNQRQYTRVPFRIQAELALPGGKCWKAEITDLSVNGAFLKSTDPPACGPVEIQMELLHGEPAWTVRARGAIVRSEAQKGAAVRFDELIGNKSFVHLERLVMLNAENVAAVEQELQIQHGIVQGGENSK